MILQSGQSLVQQIGMNEIVRTLGSGRHSGRERNGASSLAKPRASGLPNRGTIRSHDLERVVRVIRPTRRRVRFASLPPQHTSPSQNLPPERTYRHRTKAMHARAHSFPALRHSPSISPTLHSSTPEFVRGLHASHQDSEAPGLPATWSIGSTPSQTHTVGSRGLPVLALLLNVPIAHPRSWELVTTLRPAGRGEHASPVQRDARIC